MKTYTLRCEMIAAVSLDETFAVFEDPYNLARITPPWLNFQVTSPEPVVMREGAEIVYRIRWLGLPLHWKTVITAHQPPHMFVDQQVEGPYTLWRHRHTFDAVAGGTRVTDQVDYILPLGPLGKIAHAMMVGRQLREIFAYRQHALRDVIGGESARYQLSPVWITA